MDKIFDENVPDFVEEEVVTCQFSDAEESDSDNLLDDVDARGRDEKEGDNNLPNQVHPLHNPVILTHMFELCPAATLATFRLVNKTWYKLSLQSWRSEVVITLDAKDLREKGSEFFWEPPLPKLPKPIILRILHSASDYTRGLPVLERRDIYSSILEKFTYYVEEPDHDCVLKPFRKFLLEEWEMRGWSEQIAQFVNLCGPFITNLELNQCFFHDLTTFRDVLFKWFPNLEKFALKRAHCRWFVRPVEEPKSWKPPQEERKRLKYLEIDMDHEQLPISWMELFSHFPNLTTFKVYNADVEESVELMLNAMKIIRKHDPRKLQLKHLDILQASLYAQDKISPEVCLLLRDLKLPLKSLTIDVGVHRDGKKVQDILQWHADTLIKLDAYRGPISIPYHDFPFGVHLHALQEIVMSDRLSESLSFLRYIPNLAKLKICDVVDDRPPIISTDIVKNTDARLMKNVKLEKCKELRFDYVITSKEMEMLVGCLPNVEKLKIPISEDEQFRLICDKWQNSMSEMELLGDKVDDCTITGLSPKEVKVINDLAIDKEWESADEEEAWPVPHHVNITVMKELRKFTMGNEDILPTNLMDCSAIHGFLKLPKLESLHIASQMKNRARNALIAKIPDCTVVRIRNPNVDNDMSWESD